METSRAFLKHVLTWDERRKLNRDQDVVEEPFPDVSDQERVLMGAISHRMRVPGLSRGRLLEKALEVVRHHDGEHRLKTLIDFGGGAGNDSIFFAKAGFDVTDADLPGPIDESISKRFEMRKLSCRLRDIRSLGDRKFDVLSSMDVLEHIYDVEDALANMLHWVRDGGVLIIQEDCFNVIYNNDHLEKNRFYHGQLHAYLRPYCRLLNRFEKVFVFQKLRGDDAGIEALKRRLYRKTAFRAWLRMVILYPLIGLSPLEAAFWGVARFVLPSFAGVVASLTRRDRDFVEARIPSLLYKRKNYLMIDRFSDAVYCYRIACDRLVKLSAKGRQAPAKDPEAPGTGP